MGQATAESILLPMLGMMLLTLVVWVYMYIQRIGYCIRNRVRTQDLTTPDRVAELIPAPVSYSAYNFRNLLELPALFYVLCLFLYVTSSVDEWHLVAAWLFVALRVVHSVIHCTVNIVIWRFYAYFASALVLWIMLVRVVLRIALSGIRRVRRVVPGANSRSRPFVRGIGHKMGILDPNSRRSDN